MEIPGLSTYQTILRTSLRTSSTKVELTGTVQMDNSESINLSLSAGLLEETAVYNANGTLGAASVSSAGADSALAQAGESEPDAESQMVADALARYQDLVTNWVERLLRGIVEDQNGVPGILETGQTQGTGLSDYYSPEQTAARIVNFALSFYDGSDRAAYAEKIKAAILKGYDQAQESSGGSLPQVCNDTITLAVDAIDTWENGTDQQA